MTQEQLAEKIDISTNAVEKLENNFMIPSLQTLVNIANVLGMDMYYPLQRDSTPSKGEAGDDALLRSLIRGLSQRDKDFIIHIINGLKIYNASESGWHRLVRMFRYLDTSYARLEKERIKEQMGFCIFV